MLKPHLDHTPVNTNVCIAIASRLYRRHLKQGFILNFMLVFTVTVISGLKFYASYSIGCSLGLQGEGIQH